ncbi:MAG: NUDIX hydrolase [Acidobacteriota bacterium]
MNFKWQKIETVYREVRPSRHGAEQRWILNQETIANLTTGETVTRGTIRHPGICVIIPSFDDGRLLLMRQYRYPAGEAIWELPAGTIAGREENGRMVATELPEICAERELREETGYQARNLRHLGSCYAMPGSSDEMIHLFAATGLTAGDQSLDIGEVIEELRAFSRNEVLAMIASGEIRDAKTIVALALFLGLSAGG